MITLDASAALELFLGTVASIAIDDAVGTEPILVPAHFDAEIWSALHRLMRQGHIEPQRALEAIRLAEGLDAERVALAPLLASAFTLRDRFAAADALYVVVAREARATLFTCDRRLANGAEGVVPVRYFPAA